MPALSVGVYVCRTAEGEQHLVSLLPVNLGFAKGLPGKAIVGKLRRPPGAGDAITPELFVRNRAFVDFLHAVIARKGPTLPGVVRAARSQGDGFVYIIDQRTPDPSGEVPPEDIVGAFKVQRGAVVSYEGNPKHVVWSHRGLFHLGDELNGALMLEIEALSNSGE